MEEEEYEKEETRNSTKKRSWKTKKKKTKQTIYDGLFHLRKNMERRNFRTTYIIMQIGYFSFRLPGFHYSNANDLHIQQIFVRLIQSRIQLLSFVVVGVMKLFCCCCFILEHHVKGKEFKNLLFMNSILLLRLFRSRRDSN